VPPFHGHTEAETFEPIVKGVIDFEDDNVDISQDAIDLFVRLLRVDPSERLEAIAIQEVQQHR
jgi:hypothetical protein